MIHVPRFILGLLLLPLLLDAQIGLVTHTVKEGLSQNTVTCIYRDGNGFLWVGTQDGLNQFDGFRFIRYRHDEKDSTSISDRYVTAIMEDGSGNLLVGTRNGLNLLDRSGRRFLRIYPDSNLRKGIQYAFEKIERAGNGDLFLSGADFLYHWDQMTRKIQRIRTEDPTIQNFTAYGDACYQFGRQGQWIKYQAPFKFAGSSEPDALFKEKYRVQVDRKARIWVWTQPSDELARFERYDITTGRWMDPIEIAEKVNHIAFDRENTAWVSTMNGIALVLESGAIRQFEVDGEMLGSEVLFTHTDSDGVTWIGFARRGLAMFEPTMKAFERKLAPLKDEPVLTSLELPDGDLLMGTPSGLCLSSKRGNRLVTQGATVSLKRTDGGEIWVGTESRGIIVLDPSLRVKRRFDKGNGTFRENRIHHLEYDGSGDRMIVSTIDGAYVHSLKDGTWTTLSAGSPGNPYSPLCGNYVLHSTVLRNGDLLFSTNSGYSIVGLNGKPRRKVYSDSDTCRFIRKTIITGSAEDGNGDLWISTLSRGVYKEQRDTLICLNEEDGLSSNLVYSIAADEKGRVWLATSSGIDIIEPSSRKVLHLSEYRGMPTADFSFGCLSGGSDGLVRVNSSVGLISVKASEIIPSARTLKPYIHRVAINYEEVDVKPEYTLSPLDKSLSFEFITPSYQDPKRVVFQYRIARIQDKWVTLAPDSRSLTLTNLPSGESLLELRCSDDLRDIERAKILETRIIVPLPFWKNPYYLVPASIMLMLLVAALVRRSARMAMSRRLRESEMLYKERERISRDLHDNLGAYAACIKNDIVALERNPDEVSGFRNLKENTDELLNALRETIWVLQNETIHITSLSDRFKNIINRLGNGYPSVAVEMRERIDTEMELSPTEGINLIRIMQEALTNAIRHSGCSRILIDIESSERLLIRIVDNGAGFNPDSKGEGTFGIGNMRSRAREAGFGFELVTSETGTEVVISVDRSSSDRSASFLQSKQGG